jgi:flagellar hook-associated protein 2
MTIRFGSINTGLPPNIVEQLIEAEKLPIKSMENQKQKSESKLKLVDELSAKVSDIRKNLGELAGTRGFQDIKLVSGDPNVISGTVDPQTAHSGNWNIEVVSLPQKAAVLTNGFPDKDKTEVGVGYMRFETSDGNRDVYINGDNNTLEGVARTINMAKPGVLATVINDRKDPEAPWKLVLSADGVGMDKKVEYPTVYMLDGDQDIFFDGEVEAKNGTIKIDGFDFEVSDTSLKDMIPGVTLELKNSAPGKSISLTVKEDLEVVSGKVKSFVDSVNGVFSFIQTQNKLDKGSDTTKTLGGDGLLRSLEHRLHGLVMNPQLGVGGSIQTLNQLGIQFNRAGTLDFDIKKFNSVLARAPTDVAAFFGGDGFNTGFVAAVRRETGSLLNPSFGPITNRASGLKQKIGQMDQRIATKEKQLEKKEEQLRAKFSRLEETMSKIKGQASQLGAMGGGGSGLVQSG